MNEIKLIKPHLAEAIFIGASDPTDPVLLDDATHETVDYDPSNKEHVAAVIATRIMKDMQDRRGLRQEFDQCDDEIKMEIFEEWKSIAQAVLEQIP